MMFILIKDNKLLEKYQNIWTKVSISIKKEFNGEPIHNEKYLKTKIISLINFQIKSSVNPRGMFMIIEYLKKVLIAFVYQ